jgi:hypothetical protein
MKNPIKEFLGNEIAKIKNERGVYINIGTQIEDGLGIKKNNGKGSDFKVWEIKSKNIQSKSMITLGGCIENNLELYVYNKIRNTILIEYENFDNYFKVEKITILYNLKYDNFLKAPLYLEDRKRQLSLRLHYKYFIGMYGKYRIEYTI